MKILWLFLKWLVIPYGTTKVHPAMGLRYFPGLPPDMAEDVLEAKMSKVYQEQECEICGVKCWKWRKNAPPICTTWYCYKKYYTKPKSTLSEPYTMLTKEKFLEDIDRYNKCPKCGNSTITDEVDIGVGTMHSPARCNSCGWSQEEEIKKTMKDLGLQNDK